MYIWQATVWCKPGYVINNTESQSANVSCGADRTFGDVPVCVGKVLDDQIILLSNICLWTILGNCVLE